MLDEELWKSWWYMALYGASATARMAKMDEIRIENMRVGCSNGSSV